MQSSYVVEDIVTSDHNPVIAEIYRRPAASALGWVDESFLTTGRTGTWTPSVAWDSASWTAELGGTYSFEANTPSGGNVVTMTVTASFDAVPMEEATPDGTAQGAVWIGTNGCFQVWTQGNVANVEMLPMANANTQLATGNIGTGNNGNTGNIPCWLDVAAEGVTPQTGVEYTFRFVFNYATGRYSVYVKTGSTGFTRLRAKNPDNPVNPVQNFPIAVPASRVSRVKFTGDGVFTSLLGEWSKMEKGMRILLR